MSLESVVRFYPEVVVSPSLSGVRIPGTKAQVAQIINKLRETSKFRKGIPDILIYLPDSIVLNLEYKKPKTGVQSKDQKEVEALLNNLGHNYYLVTSMEETLKYMAKHTRKEYRLKQYSKIVGDLEDPITVSFLNFKEGTNKSDVEDALRQVYRLT